MSFTRESTVLFAHVHAELIPVEFINNKDSIGFVQDCMKEIHADNLATVEDLPGVKAEDLEPDTWNHAMGTSVPDGGDTSVPYVQRDGDEVCQDDFWDAHKVAHRDRVLVRD